MFMALVGNVHIVEGSRESLEALFGILKIEGIATDANPDVSIREYSHFGIEDAREIRERALLRAVGARRVFVVVTPTMTTDAQNALLKTLEEPLMGTLFFFVVPSPQTLLPTLRSRSQVLTLDIAPPRDARAMQFLTATPSERLEMIKPLLEKGEDDRRDMSDISMLLSSLESEMGLMKQSATRAEGFVALYRVKKYIGDKGALIKPLMEQLALLVPKLTP